MYCIKCGKEISDESLFCNFCGSKVAQISDNAENNTVLTTNNITDKLTSGREAKKRKDWHGVQRIYQSILAEVPDQYEALFYDAYAKAMESMSGQDVFKRKAEMEVVHNLMNDLPNYYARNGQDNAIIVSDILTDLKELICSSFVFTETKNGFGIVVDSNACDTYAIFVETVRLFNSVINSLYEKSDDLKLHRCALDFYLGAKNLDWDYNSKVAIANDLTRWVDEENQRIETIRRIPIEAYWKEHAEERKLLETERDDANAEIAKLKEEIETLEESHICKRIESDLKETDYKLSDTGVIGIIKGFSSTTKEKGLKNSILGIKGTVSDKRNEKKQLLDKRTEIEKSLADAKARLDEVSKPQNDRIAFLQQRIEQIEEEFNKDR